MIFSLCQFNRSYSYACKFIYFEYLSQEKVNEFVELTNDYLDRGVVTIASSNPDELHCSARNLADLTQLNFFNSKNAPNQ